MPEAARAGARTGTGQPSTGFAAIDQLLGGLRVGDNVVWRLHGASREPFTAAFLRAGAALPRLAYVSFDASTAEVLAQYGTEGFPAASVVLDCSSGGRPKRARRAAGKGPAVRMVEDPTNILAVTAALTAIEREFGPGTRYVFDDLTTIQKAWGREAALGLFLEHCPRLFDLETVAYWFLDADEHDQSFLERMTQLTQVVLDVEPSGDDVLVAVAKAQGRSSASAGKRARIALADGTGTIVDSLGGDRGSSGERLRQLRMDKGLSQAHLARQAGITPSALSQAERGVSALSEETLGRIRRSLGFVADEIRTADDTPYRVWRRGERRRRRLAAGLESSTVLTDDAGLSVHSLEVAGRAAGKRPPFPTKRPEAVLVESGVLEVKVNDATEVLHAGDALLLRDDSVSSWRNPGLSEARVLWIIFPGR